MLAAVVVAVPVFPHVSASSPAQQTLDHSGVGPSGGLVGPEDLPVVERQISSDMVVDWLETPPADGADWLRGPEAPADHGIVIDDHDHDHHEHDHGDGDDETFQTEAANPDGASAGSSDAQASSAPGQGFAVFSASPRWLPGGYTVRLTGADARIEQYRDELEAAARAASRAAGLPVRMAPHRGGAVRPSRGEITVVLGEGPCGSDAVGCGGPALTSTELVSGRVWIHPRALNMSPAAKRSGLAAHELGHALGLQHYRSSWRDGRQVMHPVISDVSTYRAGDGGGLRFMAGGYDRPSGRLTAHSYAAGHIRVEGDLSSGTKVRVAVGSTSRDVTAAGGRFSAQIPAPAGSNRVCATSLDAATGFRRALGCADVTAPGTPFGHIDAVSNSFQTIRVAGWAIDPQTAAPVDVEVRRNGSLVKTASADVERADVAAAHRHYGAAHGFSLEVPAVAGVNAVCVRILGVGGGGNQDLGCTKVSHAVDPVGAFEVAVSSDMGATVSGWALDPNTPSPVHVTVSVDGTVPAVPGTFRAADDRPDVARAYPSHGPSHGFRQRLVLSSGTHDVCLTVTNVGAGEDRSLGCTEVLVEEHTGTVVGKVPSPSLSSSLDTVPAVQATISGAHDQIVGARG